MYVIYKGGSPVMLKRSHMFTGYVVNPYALEYLPDEFYDELKSDSRYTIIRDDKKAKKIIEKAKKLGVPPAKYYLEQLQKENSKKKKKR